MEATLVDDAAHSLHVVGALAITVGIVLLMVRKPALLTSLPTITLAVGIGVASGLVSGTREACVSAIGRAVPPTDAKR